MHARSLIVAVTFALLSGAAGAEVNLSLAGQTVTTPISGGEHRKEYAPNGQLVYEVIEQVNGSDRKASEREWTQEGSPLREQEFLNGTQMRATFWYMNGQVREKHVNQALRDPKGPPGDYVEYFSDLGLPQASGVMQGQFKRVGVHRLYDEHGKLKVEQTYDASGQLVSEKKIGPDGSAGQEQGFYPDGSRRLN